MTYTIAVCTVQNCWWWTEELSETCRDLFQKLIWEISASGWFCYKNLSRCTLTWTSNCENFSMTYTIAVCTVQNCWWWTEELSETRRVLFQKLIWEISASVGFIIRIYHDARSHESQIILKIFCSFWRTIQRGIITGTLRPSRNFVRFWPNLKFLNRF